MDKIVVNLKSVDRNGKSRCMQYGQAYVALSRVRNFDGLFLTAFESKNIRANPSVIAEMHRLNISSADDQNCNTPISTEIIQANVQMPNFGLAADQNYVLLPDDHSADVNSISDQQTTASAVKLSGVFKYCDFFTASDSFFAECAEKIDVTFQALKKPIVTFDRRIRDIKDLIIPMCGENVCVEINNVAGDGNCLFNAFALAFCGSQSFSGVVRDAIVAHMISPEYRDEIQAALVPANSQQMDQFNRHIENMLTDREWGTDQEIIAAANYFNCSILCFSLCNRNLVVQHLSSHFAAEQQCSDECHHKSIFLLNESGGHYDLVVIRKVSL